MTRRHATARSGNRMSDPGSSPLRVFISYSHETSEHDRGVMDLANRLRADGVDCRLDQDQTSPTQGWPRWMLDQVRLADVVLTLDRGRLVSTN